MKRTIAFLLVAAMLLALVGCKPETVLQPEAPIASAEEALQLDTAVLRPEENSPNIYASAIKSAISIDGSLDEWHDYPSVTLGAEQQIGVGNREDWTGRQDLSGSVTYVWDEKNIYIGFEVMDDTLVQKYTGEALWKGDHVEMWFDTELENDFADTEPSDDDFQIGFSPGNFDNVKEDIFIWQPEIPSEYYDESIKYSVKRTDTGYTCEIRIPSSILNDVDLHQGLVMGACFELGDRDMTDGSEQEFLMSTAPKSSSAWGNPTNWGNLIFVGTPQVTPPADSIDTAAAVNRTLSNLNTLESNNIPSDVTGIFGYGFDAGDVTKPITEETLQAARDLIKQCHDEGALWIDADTAITNTLSAFINDPEISYYPLCQAIVSEAHKYGIKVFFYFSGSEIVTPGYADLEGLPIEKLHPDWMQIDQLGNPFVFNPGDLDMFWLEPGDGDAYCSPLSSGYREAIMTRAEKVSSFGADGIYVDVPYFFSFNERWADFSESSAAAFKAATGNNLPRNLEGDGKVFYEWLDWRHQVWADFFGEMKARCTAKNPDVEIIVEEYPGYLPADAIVTGLDTAVLDGSIDIACHEFGHKQDDGGSLAYDLLDWQYTRNIYKWYQGFNRNNWSLCYATGVNDSKALAAITWMHQQSFWEAQAPLMVDATVDSGWRKQAMDWIRDFCSVFNPAQSVAEVAVVYSSRSRNYTMGSCMEQLQKVQRLLDKAQVPYVILHEDQIEKMHNFKYVIFPDTKYATQKVLNEAEKYQGNLMLTDSALTRDGWDENDVDLGVKHISAREAVNSISTVPYKITGGEGLFVDVFRHDNEIQLRFFNPHLDSDFQAEACTISIEFTWNGEAPDAYILNYLDTSIQKLSVVKTDSGYKVDATVGMAAVIGIG